MTDEKITLPVMLCAGAAIVHIWLNTVALPGLQTLSILHFSLLALVLFAVGPWPASIAGRVWHVASTLLPSVPALYLLVQTRAFYDRGMVFTDLEFVAVLITILGAIEFARRSGWLVAAIIVFFAAYALWWGRLIDGPLGFPGLKFTAVMFRSIYTDDGMFGSIAGISASFVFIFVLFGSLLMRSGGCEFVVDLARVASRRFVGGSGYVAVAASALTGTISGSAVANTVTTGFVTIPLMIVEWAGGHLLLALLLVALASLVLGMGLPITAAYVVLATLSAPALAQIVATADLAQTIGSGTVADSLRPLITMFEPSGTIVGQGTQAARDWLSALPPDALAVLTTTAIDPVAMTGFLVGAHLAVFWRSQDSNVTPPVYLTGYAAATIAGSKPLKTGLIAWRIAKSIYVMPVAFFTTPVLDGTLRRPRWRRDLASVALYDDDRPRRVPSGPHLDPPAAAAGRSRDCSASGSVARASAAEWRNHPAAASRDGLHTQTPSLRLCEACFTKGLKDVRTPHRLLFLGLFGLDLPGRPALP